MLSSGPQICISEYRYIYLCKFGGFKFLPSLFLLWSDSLWFLLRGRQAPRHHVDRTALHETAVLAYKLLVNFQWKRSSTPRSHFHLKLAYPMLEICMGSHRLSTERGWSKPLELMIPETGSSLSGFYGPVMWMGRMKAFRFRDWLWI